MRKKEAHWNDNGEYKIVLDNQCRNILNQLPSLIWYIDTNNNIRYVNKAITEFLEGSIEELQDGAWMNYIHPEDREEFLQKREEALIKREVISCEFRMRHKRHGYRWLSICISPYHNEAGSFLGSIGIANDITDQKEADDLLKRYELLSKNTRDIILFLDLSGKIVEANKAAVATYGYTYEELCSITIRDISEEWNYTAIMMEQANKTGIFYQTLHKRKDGSYLSVEVSSQGADIGGRRILLNIIRDITDRKKAEKELTKSHSCYRSLVMNMNNGYACFRIINDDNNIPIDAKILEFNDIFKQYFNLTKDNAANHYISETSSETLSQVLDFITENKNELYGGRCIRKDCLYVSSFDMWLSMSVYCPEKDKIILIVTDITDQKKNELRLTEMKEVAEATNRSKNEFSKVERGLEEVKIDASTDSSVVIKLKELLMDIKMAEAAMRYDNPEIVGYILRDMAQISGAINEEKLRSIITQMEEIHIGVSQDDTDSFKELEIEVRKVLERYYVNMN